MYLLIYLLIMWLVVTEVRSKSFRLVTERRHYNTHPIYVSLSYIANVIFFIVECGIAHFLCAMPCMYSKFGHHPHPLGYLCAKFRFRGSDLRCWASLWRKTAHSLAQLILCPGNQSFRFGILHIFQLCFSTPQGRHIHTIENTDTGTKMTAQVHSWTKQL